ncbi:lipopolysaccharide assembly protein LapB [Allobaculum sp. Allo2]|uniref:tetratricopeptide repeat protein n=1 Tax=Allobaculum sp. Allo2 TaxID=2853432 RepID=UPI001F619C90|nr:tetratricopeptide repeat protein [Allobaculum sp. Allo2]UNT92941.1 tetratricopeptide repeat protein [Allobaculum sp. Allo2]
METQDYDKAEEALLEAKKIDPKRSDTYEQLYSLYSNQGDEEQLIGLVEEAQTVLDQQENDTFTQNVNEMAEAGQAVPIEEVMNAAADTIQYSKHMNEAMDSLEQADVATAVRLLNSAIEINPARSDAYLLLYQVLIESGDVIEAQQVVADAHASLPDSEQEEFDTQLANVTRPEEDGKTDPGWTKVADLGPLDFTPIEIGEQGWLIAADGVYGFVTPQGKVTRTDRKLSCEILLKNSQAKIPESIQSVSLRADDQGKQYEITKDLHEAKAVPVKKEEKPSSAKKEESRLQPTRMKNGCRKDDALRAQRKARTYRSRKHFGKNCFPGSTDC